MDIKSWNVPSDRRVALYCGTSKPPPQYILCEEGAAPPEGKILSLAPMYYVTSEPLRFPELALEQAFAKIEEQVKIAHGKLEVSGLPPDLTPHILIFQAALQTGRDESRNHVCTVGWSCFFGDIEQKPDWLQEFEWREYAPESK